MAKGANLRRVTVHKALMLLDIHNFWNQGEKQQVLLCMEACLYTISKEGELFYPNLHDSTRHHILAK